MKRDRCNLESFARICCRVGRRLLACVPVAALAPLAAAQPMGPAGPAYPPMQWVAHEHKAIHPSADDQGVDIVYWKEVNQGQPDGHWIYVTGWVTEMDGNTVIGSRFATYKYDATHAGPSAPVRQATAFFPPLEATFVEGDTYKAVAMALDPLTGDIYIIGEGPRTPGGTDQDYWVVKYNKYLVKQWDSSYDGPVSGDDIPADIVYDEPGAEPEDHFVVVTGTSPGDGTGLDIANAAWYAVTGAPAGTPTTGPWPPDGVRRFNGAANGDDSAVELARSRSMFQTPRK